MNESILRSPKKPDVDVLRNLEDICVAGITPFTTIDYPGCLAGVFYLQGCPWRCRYCYNAEFWPLPPEGNKIPFEKVRDFLFARQGRLEGIVFSGGEPTAHTYLSRWMDAVKKLGFKIGLHTAGIYPERLQKIIPYCDWMGLDIKAPFQSYEKVTQISSSGAEVRESAALIIKSGKPYEFRTTFHPDLLSHDEILSIAREISAMGCKNYALQQFQPDFCPDKKLRKTHPKETRISSDLHLALQSLFVSLVIRPSSF